MAKKIGEQNRTKISVHGKIWRAFSSGMGAENNKTSHAEGNYLVYEFGVMGTQTSGTRIFTRVQRGLKSKILILLSLLAMTILFLSNVTHVICSVEPLNVCMLLSSVILQYLISPSLPLDTITP